MNPAEITEQLDAIAEPLLVKIMLRIRELRDAELALRVNWTRAGAQRFCLAFGYFLQSVDATENLTAGSYDHEDHARNCLKAYGDDETFWTHLDAYTRRLLPDDLRHAVIARLHALAVEDARGVR